jgi:hypothetical protein
VSLALAYLVLVVALEILELSASALPLVAQVFLVKANSITAAYTDWAKARDTACSCNPAQALRAMAFALYRRLRQATA